MAYLLRLANTGERVDNLSYPNNFTSEIRIDVRFKKTSFVANAAPMQVGSSGSTGFFQFRCRTTTDSFDVRLNDGTIKQSAEFTVQQNQINTISFIYAVATSLLSIRLNGVEVASINASRDFLSGELRLFQSLDNLYECRVFEDGTLVRDYDASLSGGTGLVLQDATGNDAAGGKLTNFANDDSQWVVDNTEPADPDPVINSNVLNLTGDSAFVIPTFAPTGDFRLVINARYSEGKYLASSSVDDSNYIKFGIDTVEVRIDSLITTINIPYNVDNNLVTVELIRGIDGITNATRIDIRVNDALSEFVTNRNLSIDTLFTSNDGSNGYDKPIFRDIYMSDIGAGVERNYVIDSANGTTLVDEISAQNGTITLGAATYSGAPLINITSPTWYDMIRTGEPATFNVTGQALNVDDGAQIDYSIDDGATWQVLGTVTNELFTGSFTLSGEASLIVALNSNRAIRDINPLIVSTVTPLAIGQSNQAGRSPYQQSTAIQNGNPRAFVLQQDRSLRYIFRELDTDPTKHTVNPDNTTVRGSQWPRIATRISNDLGKNVLLYNIAEGGTRIELWQKGNAQNLYPDPLALPEKVRTLGATDADLFTYADSYIGETDIANGTSIADLTAQHNAVSNALFADYGVKTLLNIPTSLDPDQAVIDGVYRDLAENNNNILLGADLQQVVTLVDDGGDPDNSNDATQGDGLHVWTTEQINLVGDARFNAINQQIFNAAQPNQPPIANAGQDQSVAAGVRVQLNATLSTDPEDGSISQFGWEQVDNGADAVVLEFANTATPEFTAPSSLTAQTLEFRVQAQDSEGATSTDTVNVNVAALEENEILSTMETLDFELVTQGNIVAYKGRSNREVMQLKPSSSTGIVTDGGYLDLSNNGIRKVEIIASGKTISNEASDSIKIDGTKILARLGDLDIPTSGKDSITPPFMIVLYVGSDTRGLVAVSSANASYKPLSYRFENVA
ncbi:hypothetical protein MTsDn5_08630 [Alteromonas gracilis]|uniref:PKD domain-containing protein n=1 Tax=Alteromonas gracilis TaxID=1479524 RepID=UPI0036F42834